METFISKSISTLTASYVSYKSPCNVQKHLMTVSLMKSFYSIHLAYAKLEWLKERNNINHFAMKTKIYPAALKAAYEELKNLSTPKAA